MIPIPDRQTIKRRLLRFLVCRLSRWDRLHVAIGCLEAMDHKQREGAVLAIVRKYHGERVHIHSNPKRKQKEEQTHEPV